MICAVLVIVPGDGVAWSQCKNPCQDIAAFQHGLDVFDFVRIGCGHNEDLPITFKQISASTSPPLALPHGDVRFVSKADIYNETPRRNLQLGETSCLRSSRHPTVAKFLPPRQRWLLPV